MSECDKDDDGVCTMDEVYDAFNIYDIFENDFEAEVAHKTEIILWNADNKHYGGMKEGNGEITADELAVEFQYQLDLNDY